MDFKQKIRSSKISRSPSVQSACKCSKTLSPHFRWLIWSPMGNWAVAPSIRCAQFTGQGLDLSALFRIRILPFTLMRNCGSVSYLSIWCGSGSYHPLLSRFGPSNSLKWPLCYTFSLWCGSGSCFSLWYGSGLSLQLWYGSGSSFPLWCGTSFSKWYESIRIRILNTVCQY